MSAVLHHENNITVIKFVTPSFLEKLIHQNKAELQEINDGCLLDNMLYDCKNGFMAVYESYMNCWSSCYTVNFSRDYSVADEYYR